MTKWWRLRPPPLYFCRTTCHARLAYNDFAISIQCFCQWHTMILPVAYDVFVNQVSSFTPKGYICQWTQCGSEETARRVRVLSTAGHARRKRCYRHLVCCMTGPGYNPHTFLYYVLIKMPQWRMRGGRICYETYQIFGLHPAHIGRSGGECADIRGRWHQLQCPVGSGGDGRGNEW